MGDRRELSLEDVELMIGSHQESQVFELSDCIGRRDLPRAMALLSRLETQGASPIAVIATLHNALREMGVPARVAGGGRGTGGGGWAFRQIRFRGRVGP